MYKRQDLARLQDGRFSILEDVRHVTTSSGMSATISLGIGKDGGSFAETYRFASLAIEMSLSRGGDQAVIKDRFNFTFYGGRTKEAERHTRCLLYTSACTATVLYPFVSSLSDLEALRPQLSVDGAGTETAIYPGAFPGWFGPASPEPEQAEQRWNLRHAESWTEYQTLLSGSYQMCIRDSAGACRGIQSG